MKSIIKFAFILLVINVILFSEIVSAKSTKLKNKKLKNHKKQVHLVADQNGFQSNFNHVIRRDPTVSVVTRLGEQRLEAPSNFIYTSNSNSNNGPNIGFLGRTAELVGNIFIISKIFWFKILIKFFYILIKIKRASYCYFF